MSVLANRYKQIIAVLLIGISATAGVDFTRDIRPLLNSKCTSCHGGVKKAGNISYLNRTDAMAKGKSGAIAIIPGDAKNSEMIRRITSKSPDERMPPADHGDGEPLTAKQIQLLTDWINAGAYWQDHWAYEPPQPFKIPEVKNKTWGNGTVDRFILATLEAKELTPLPEADRAVLLRRLTFDLIGLPPTIEELDTFIADTKPGAYERAVDRLLASPRYGERWASMWMDVMRYADSKGLGSDATRNIWKYRDWLIDAFNEDMPWDQFTIKQLAGDLLPEPSVRDFIATAAHRNTQTNEEGGTDDEEFRIEAAMDRVSTTWQAWQGLTFGCVQCHDHPYDPFRHDEYYKFMAFFNNTADCDTGQEYPHMRIPNDPKKYDEASKLLSQIRPLRKKLFLESEALVQSTSWKNLTGMTATSTRGTKLVTEVVDGVEQFVTKGNVTKSSDHTITAPIPADLRALTAIAVNILPFNPDTALKDAEVGFVLSQVSVQLVPKSGKAVDVALARVLADEEQPLLDPQASLNPKHNHGFGAYPRIHHARRGVLVPKSPIPVSPGSKLRVVLKHRIFELAAFRMISRRGFLSVANDKRWRTFLNTEARVASEKRLRDLQSAYNKIPGYNLPVMQDRSQRLARPTHLFERGNFLNKGKKVQAGTPRSFPPLGPPADATAGYTRLDMAKWLASKDNPLTARTAVNRFWYELFGTGIVETLEDLGSAGALPTHPKLLDYLALRFQNDYGWRVKPVIKEIVMSAAYRQQPYVDATKLKKDVGNHLLTRGPRRRLTAEMTRDQALASADVLSAKMHGPPVRPPLPVGYWRPFAGGDKWNVSKGEDRYRRAIYVYWKRSLLYPLFSSFDAPTREFCNPRRIPSNTPVQALTALNDPAMTELHAKLADRLLTSSNKLDEQLALGFRIATSVQAKPNQVTDLRKLFETVKAERSAANDKAPDRAAMMVVAGALLNLDQALTR